jgi:hypothetical protein
LSDIPGITLCPGEASGCHIAQLNQFQIIEILEKKFGPSKRISNSEDVFQCYEFTNKDKVKEYLDIVVVANGASRISKNATCEQYA